MRAAVVALVLALAGCHAADPCSGKSGACLAVEAEGSGVGALDELVVTVRDGAGGTQMGGTGLVTPAIALPVQFAALLRDGTNGAVTVDVVGRRAGAPVAQGSAGADVPASGRARVTVTLSPLGGSDLGGDGGITVGNLTLAPSSIDIGRVPSGMTGTAMFSVNAAGDVTLGAAMLSPQPSGLAIATTSTCANLQTLHAGDSCEIVVDYSPNAAASIGSTLMLPTSAGTLTAVVTARSPGLVNESLATGTPPSFDAVFTVDGRTAYAVGSPNAVWRRDPVGGWTAATGPGGNGDNLTGVWAASVDDVYVADSLSAKLYHSTDRAKTWTTIATGLVMPAVSVSGSDANDIFVAGSDGDIAYGTSAGTQWSVDRAADNLAWVQIVAANGAVLATRAAQVDVRAAPDNWTVALDVTGMATFRSVWGASSSDFYAAGQKTNCTTNACGVVYHKSGGNTAVPYTIGGVNSFNGVFGTPGGLVYAVGTGGVIASDDGTGFATKYLALSELDAIHGAGGELYAVGGAGTIEHIIE